MFWVPISQVAVLRVEKPDVGSKPSCLREDGAGGGWREVGGGMWEEGGGGAGTSSLTVRVCCCAPGAGVYGELVSQPLFSVLMCVFSHLLIV